MLTALNSSDQIFFQSQQKRKSLKLSSLPLTENSTSKYLAHDLSSSSLINNKDKMNSLPKNTKNTIYH